MNLRSVRLFCLGNPLQEEEISMIMGRFKHIQLAVMIGISLFIPLLLAYSVYVDMSATRLLSSDMSLEDSEDEDSSISQDEFKVFIPASSSTPLLFGSCFGRWSGIFPSPSTLYLEITPVLRC